MLILISMAQAMDQGKRTWTLVAQKEGYAALGRHKGTNLSTITISYNATGENQFRLVSMIKGANKRFYFGTDKHRDLEGQQRSVLTLTEEDIDRVNNCVLLRIRASANLGRVCNRRIFYLEQDGPDFMRFLLEQGRIQGLNAKELTPTSAEDTCSRFFSDSDTPEPPVMQLADMVSLLPIDPAAGLAARRNFLIGKTIKGVLLHRRGGYFIKWNDEIADAVYRSSEEGISTFRDGCTIESLGPGKAHWTKQHPFAKKIDVVTRYWRNQVKGVVRLGLSPPPPPCSESFPGRVRSGQNAWANSRLYRRNRTIQKCGAL